MINKVIFSASVDDTRPILKGCLIETSKDRIVSVALDGYRLAMCNKNIVESTRDIKAVVPARALSEIAKFIGEDEALLTVYVQKNHIMIMVDSTTVISRLLEGEFINYKMIIPNDFTSSAIVDRLQFEKP